MSTADHATCCRADTLDDLRAIKADYEAAKSERDELANRLNQSLTNYLALRSAYWSANCDRDELANALAAAIAERDRARNIAVRLEAELARGFHIAAPDITLTRDNDDPATPDMAARALAIRLEAEAAQPYLPAQMPEAVPREGQEGAENAPSRAADGLAGSDWHSGTPATGEARKSAESDAPFFAPEIGGAW